MAQQLRANDPNVLRVVVAFMGEMTTILSRPCKVILTSMISCLLSIGMDRRFPAFCRVMATRENLKKVTFGDTANPGQQARADIVRPLLQAVQQNPRGPEQLIFLHGGRFAPNDLPLVIETQRNIRKLDIEEFTVETETVERGAEELSAALQRHTNILFLQLYYLRDIFLIPVLLGLTRNVTLETLCINAQHLSAKPVRAIQNLLDSATFLAIPRHCHRAEERRL